MTRWRKTLRKAGLVSAAVAGLSTPLMFFLAYLTPGSDPAQIAKAFYKARHARDFDAAYLLVSAADRQVGGHTGYAERRVHGFALALGKRFADQMAFEVTERQLSGKRARLTINYKVPAAGELSSRLADWQRADLKTLSWTERRAILNEFTKLRKAATMIGIEGRETFNLIEENGHWKIFLDWASAIDISFDALLPHNSALDVEFLERRIFAGSDEPFQSNFRIRNRGPHEVVARIEHRIEPEEFADDLTMIACGFLRPLTLRPGDEREVASAYLLDAELPRSTRLRIAYQFYLQSPHHAVN